MDLTWDWPCGVAYYGVAKACEAAGKAEYFDALKNRVDELIGLGVPRQWTVNRCAMGHALLSLYAQSGGERYLELIESKLEYLRKDAPRFGEGVIQHTVSPNNDFPGQAWADTLFMAAYFMLRAGVALDDTDLVKDALRQYQGHIDRLQNPETGLWYHGYDSVTGGHMSGFYWARANAWAAYTMSRVKCVLPERYLFPEFMDIDGSLSEQLSALKKLQGADGLWRTILDDGESYGEVSASAGITAAMIENGNPLHSRFVSSGLEAVLANVTPDGRVTNVSGGTAVMKDRDGYRNISRRWAQGWGQGLALAALCAGVEQN
ncbi:MAG: glycoside hydrolase family 88 protein [Clostridiales bacterium]|nr:glycoside hydrolase family 88 protein [Clostridiales bacterium]